MKGLRHRLPSEQKAPARPQEKFRNDRRSGPPLTWIKELEDAQKDEKADTIAGPVTPCEIFEDAGN